MRSRNQNDDWEDCCRSREQNFDKKHQVQAVSCHHHRCLSHIVSNVLCRFWVCMHMLKWADLCWYQQCMRCWSAFICFWITAHSFSYFLFSGAKRAVYNALLWYTSSYPNHQPKTYKFRRDRSMRLGQYSTLHTSSILIWLRQSFSTTVPLSDHYFPFIIIW